MATNTTGNTQTYTHTWESKCTHTQTIFQQTSDVKSMKERLAAKRAARKKPRETEEEKQLRIKVSICKRCSKDLIYYGKEAEKQKAKIEKMKAEGRDEHDVKKQIQVLEESEEMIPLSRDQLRKAKADLKEFLESNADAITSSKYYEEAKSIVEEA